MTLFEALIQIFSKDSALGPERKTPSQGITVKGRRQVNTLAFLLVVAVVVSWCVTISSGANNFHGDDRVCLCLLFLF